MDAFSYLSVLLSIILGLAITQVLQGLRGLLLARCHVRLYLPTLIWSALILVFATQSWWASFGLADHREWSFAGFGMLLLQTVLLYMLAALVLPDFPRDEATDLREHYFREVRPFFLVILAMLAASLLKNYTIDGVLPNRENIAFHGVFAALGIVGVVTRRPIVHMAIAVLTAALMVAYIALLFARLS